MTSSLIGLRIMFRTCVSIYHMDCQNYLHGTFDVTVNLFRNVDMHTCVSFIRWIAQIIPCVSLSSPQIVTGIIIRTCLSPYQMDCQKYPSLTCVFNIVIFMHTCMSFLRFWWSTESQWDLLNLPSRYKTICVPFRTYCCARLLHVSVAGNNNIFESNFSGWDQKWAKKLKFSSSR